MLEINALLAGFVGGFIGAVLVLMQYYYYICAKTKQYCGAKQVLKDRLMIAGLEQEIVDIKAQLHAYNVEFYRQYDESTKV